MIDDLPFSQASENNKAAILAVLKRHLDNKASVLEIGGGTGQHAVYFATAFNHLHWQSSDVATNVDSLNLRIHAASLENLPSAFCIDANTRPWSCDSYDAIFSANCVHIMSAESVVNLFAELSQHLNDDGLLFLYGPFKYGGEFTTESNAQFDVWLKERNPDSGVRDFEWINTLAQSAGLRLLEDNPMPANNQMLVFKKYPLAQR